MKSTALILVDIQNDYFPQGRKELFEPGKAAANARKLLDFFRNQNLPVFFIQHVSLGSDASFFLPDTEGIVIHETVKPLDGEPIIVKHFPNSFHETPLLEKLQQSGVKDVVICGMMSHMCIDATTRAASDYGFRCTVVEDACTSPDLSFNGRTIKAADVHAVFMAALSGTYATIETADDFLAKIKG